MIMKKQFILILGLVFSVSLTLQGQNQELAAFFQKMHGNLTADVEASDFSKSPAELIAGQYKITPLPIGNGIQIRSTQKVKLPDGKTRDQETVFIIAEGTEGDIQVLRLEDQGAVYGTGQFTGNSITFDQPDDPNVKSVDWKLYFDDSGRLLYDNYAVLADGRKLGYTMVSTKN